MSSQGVAPHFRYIQIALVVAPRPFNAVCVGAVRPDRFAEIDSGRPRVTAVMSAAAPAGPDPGRHTL
ncbi:hypothetical protein GCM10010109_81180 [Actinoplanes campanulatus]|nr:hypothetical protein GCM10010109_81180 [Actinoplanes campanulatus]GID41174.1 hypothetical protein Aca09nite_76800 [Actinoplanes campanulatus]